MKSEAIYVGKRYYSKKEYVDDQGTVYPAKTGVQHLFYCSEWDGEYIEGMGRTRFYTVLDGEEDTAKDLKIGQKVTVTMRESFDQQGQNYCTYRAEAKK